MSSAEGFWGGGCPLSSCDFFFFFFYPNSAHRVCFIHFRIFLSRFIQPRVLVLFTVVDVCFSCCVATLSDVDGEHQHDDSVTSVGIKIGGELNLEKLNGWLSALLREKVGIHSILHSCIHSFMHSLMHACTHSFIRPFIHFPPARSRAYTCVHTHTSNTEREFFFSGRQCA